MKKGLFYVLILSFALVACSTSSTPPLAPTNTVPPAPTFTPSPTPDPLIFKDDFNGSLDSGWHWVNENTKRWSVVKFPGFLEIIAGPGFPGKGSVKNLLFRQIPADNFELETKLTFQPKANFQLAGLIIYESGANYIVFGRAFCKKSAVCVKDGFYMDMMMNGGVAAGNFATPAPQTDTVYLRLRKEEGTYTAYYSEDGSQWNLVGAHSSEMNALFVGLIAGQSTTGTRSARFDYFQINRLP